MADVEAQKWELYGPKGMLHTLTAAAAILGYDSADTIRRLVAEGRLPAPRGRGASQYYTGLDLAIIFEMYGRWEPAEAAAKGDRTPQKPAKPDRTQQDTPS